MMKKLFDEYMSFITENKDLIPEFTHIPLVEKQNSFTYTMRFLKTSIDLRGLD